MMSATRILPLQTIVVMVGVAATFVIGGLASPETAKDVWYQQLNKSALTPPGYVFGVVWPILYVLMAIATSRTFAAVAPLFFIQLMLNALWSWLFFAAQMPLVALLDIIILIALNGIIARNMYRADKLSALIYTPYILWLCFAAYLNLAIVIYN